MYLKRRVWIAIGILCLIGVLFWRFGGNQGHNGTGPVATVKTNPVALLSLETNKGANQAVANGVATLPFPYRISNTTRKIDELIRSDSAILLRNALIDSVSGVPLNIPAHLRSQGDPGSYIVQSRGAITEEFRAQLGALGAEIVAYVPNNAYLVHANAGVVQPLRALPQVISVIPWEPYFKLSPKLLELAVEQKPLPDANPLTVLTFPGETEATERRLRDLGATVMRRERSPFGTQLLVYTPPDKLVAVAQLGTVQAIEPAYRRELANDLARTRVRVSTNTATPNSFLGLTGSGIRVGLNDTGVSADHPDLAPRIIPDAPASGSDINGHGTHVAGIMASSGANGPIWTNVPGSTTNANFRGMAPQAQIFVQPIDLISGPLKPDSALQRTAATNGVFISNNSWNYFGAFDYTFAAANWDAAVRDSAPDITGSQAITYVFSAGNYGAGDSSGGSGRSDSIPAPANAKNVITVGAIEQLRNITNEVVTVDGSGNSQTNAPFVEDTDTDYQVASFSSRGNVGAGIEGPTGRFKPDVVAPGVFLVSTRASNWVGNLLVSVGTAYLTDEVIAVGDTNIYSFVGGPNTIEARVHVIPNSRSPVPFPTNSIYVRRGAPPPPSDSLVVSNSIIIKLNVAMKVLVGVGNNFNQNLHCDIQLIVLSTNPPTPGEVQVAMLNTNLGTLYRYESGTSMAAPVVSGLLALMQQQLRNSSVTNPSPALMKALLINGARSLRDYDLAFEGSMNFQGWGIVNLTNSMPSYSAISGNPATWPVRFFDQETNGLVTGDSHTRIINLDSNNVPSLRMSLVWTDPPGNPAVGVKLVNDLDLVVTNLTTGDVYVGNVMSGDFNSPLGTNALVTDVVNNVENVFLEFPRRGTYSVTVRAQHVNVNAVTAHNPRGIAQDYALVVSAGSPGDRPVFSIGPTMVASNDLPQVTSISNGVPVFSDQIGANPPYWTKPGTNGLKTQWRFFVFENTNTAVNTNVAFFTFLPPNLSRVRTSQEADIDLFVSTDSSLTNLNPAAIAAASTSKNEGGTEAVVFTNATSQFYYIGVKSEDQQAAGFGLFGFAGPTPFSEKDKDGNVIVHGLGVPVDIPDGSTELASGALVFAYCLERIQIRNVVVTNTLSHTNGGDLIGFLTHTRSNSVLNNHRPFEGTNVTFIYDDGDSGKILAAVPTGRPGTLRKFWGQEGQGAWQMTMIDDSLTYTGRVDGLTIRLEPAPKTNDSNIVVTILPNRWYYTVVDVPVDAILLGIDVAPLGGIVEVYVARNYVPDQNTFDYSAIFGPPGGSLEITPADSPPLSAGLYFIGLRNPNSSPLTVNLRIRLDRNLAGPATKIYTSPGGPIPLLDDAVTTALMNVTNAQDIFDVRVGVRIRHQRASDLVLTLVSPGGTRVLLAENRGGDSALGYGASVGVAAVSNLYTIFTDNTNLTLTPIKFADPPFTNQFCPSALVVTGAQVFFNGFEGASCGCCKAAGTTQDGWFVVTNDVDFLCAPASGIPGPPHSGNQALDLNGFWDGWIRQGFATVPGRRYLLSHAYCRNPYTTIPTFVATADVIIDGAVVKNISYGNFNSTANLNWFMNQIPFTATSNSTTLEFRSTTTQITPPCGTPCGGMYLDSVQVNELASLAGGCNYVFPEEPLSQMRGESPYGTWRLEIWDNRVGAPLNAQLASWQLDFDFVSTNPPVTLLTNSQCFTGTAAGSSVSYFRVKVPFVAGYATNTLTTSNANKMVLSAALTGLPVAISPPDDYPPQTNEPIVMLEINTNSAPPLPQGGFYYVGVRNDDPTTTNGFTLCVTFDLGDTNDLSSIITITNTQCITTNIAVTNLLTYFQFDASSNAIQVIFDITNMTENVDMVVRRGLPLPNPTSYDGISNNPGTNTENITITDYDFDYIPGRWYIGVYNRTNVPVTFTLCVHEVTSPRFMPVTCTNGVVIGANAVQYYQFTVLTQALRTHVIAGNANGDIDMYLNPFPPYPPPSATNYLWASATAGLLDEFIAMSLGSTPPLVPGGTYYVAIVNRDPVPVTYDFCVQQFTDYVDLTNGVCFADTILHTNDAHYYKFTILSNSVRADFMTLFADADVDLYLRRTPPPGPGFGNFDYASEQFGLADERITVTTSDFPPLTPGDWYLAVVAREPGAVSYCIQASQSGIFPITCTNTAIIPAYSVQYYQYAVSSNALRVLFQATNLTGNLDMYSIAVPPFTFPGPGNFTEVSANPGIADELITLVRATNLIAPGNYIIALTNNEAFSVSYSFCAIEITNYMALANSVCFSNRFERDHHDGHYYSFDVASSAVMAEFTLLSPTNNYDLYLRFAPPPGVATGEYDYASATNGPGTELIRIATNSLPMPLRGGRWHLLVFNWDGGAGEYCLKATQYVIPLVTNCVSGTNVPPSEVHYYQVAVASNVWSVDFTVDSIGVGDVDLYINRYPPLSFPGPGNALAQSANPGNATETVTLSTASAPPLQAPGTYFIAITNVGAVATPYRLCVRQVTNAISLTTGTRVTNTLPRINSTDYYRVTIFTNSQRADFITLDATGDVDLYVRRVPPPGSASFDYRSENGGSTNEFIMVTRTNSPPLVAGDWYIAVVNRTNSAVTYSIKVNQYPVLDPFNIALRITNMLSVGAVDLGWNAFDFQRFYLEWTPTLSTNPIPWQPFSTNSQPVEFGPYGGSGTNFWHRDQPVTAPMRFYRLRILP